MLIQQNTLTPFIAGLGERVKPIVSGVKRWGHEMHETTEAGSSQLLCVLCNGPSPEDAIHLQRYPFQHAHSCNGVSAMENLAGQLS